MLHDLSNIDKHRLLLSSALDIRGGILKRNKNFLVVTCAT
jgi:hypothetical protein